MPRCCVLLARQHEAGRALAAICAAPIALGRAGVLRGKRATCYPGFEPELTGAKLSEQRVVEDGQLITSRGPGTALEFALVLVSRLVGKAAARRLRAEMLAAG